MTITTQFRPFYTGEAAKDLEWFAKINYKWWLQRTPMLLFALVSSYGVGHLLSISDVPFPFDYLGAISFDVGFLGAISLADMQLSKKVWSNIAYYALNITMSCLGALFNVLSHAGGRYANITPEDITVGLPFALVGLAFAFYYHSIMRGYIDQEITQQKKEEEKAAETAVRCDYCGEGKKNMAAIYGHYKSCAMKTMHTNNPDPQVCRCLKCTLLRG